MSRHPITEQRLALHIPAMDAVVVDRDLPYGDASSPSLAMDVYRPPANAPANPRVTPPATPPAGAPNSRPAASGLLCPAVVLVTGYSDVGGRQILGCDLKDMAAYRDWARLLASRGIVAVTYRNEDPLRDARRLLHRLQQDADSLGIDRERIGIWSSSGNVPNALALFAAEPQLVCAALLYGYPMDLPGHDEVAKAAARFGFVNAAQGLAFEALLGRPILIARAGRDEMPGLNTSLDRFVGAAHEADLTLRVVDHADGPHAFDIMEPTDRTQMAIREIVGFLAANLSADAARSA
jgi:hypothetical protein